MDKRRIQITELMLQISIGVLAFLATAALVAGVALGVK